MIRTSLHRSQFIRRPKKRVPGTARYTSFKPKSKGDTKRSAFGQGRAAKRASSLNGRGKPLNKVGPRTRAWRAAWAFLKPRLEAANRTQCEFRFIPHECFGGLTPAHSKKRRMMEGNDIFSIAICCANFHRQLDEQMSHEQMERTVMKAINRAGGIILPDRLREAA